MFKRVPTRDTADRLASGSPTTTSRQDDDNISLTSTVESEYSEDTVFDVRAIHMEGLVENGVEKSYLVEWEGYPLHRCTWEPLDILGQKLVDDIWEDKEERQRRGDVWTWEKWDEIQHAAEQEHLARHRRRNARRKKLGLPLTEPIDDKHYESVKHEDSSRDEADEDRPLAVIAAEKRRSQAQTRKSSGTTTAPSASNFSTKPQSNAPRSEATPRLGLARKLPKDSRPAPPQARPSSTGYQGTANRPSLTATNTSTGNHTVLSAPSKSAASRVYTAKKSAAVPGATNVFAGGTIRKTRVGLKDAMSNPTKDPKLFTKYRQRRLAEKASRDKEDRPPPLTPSLFANLSPLSRKKSTATEPSSTVSETLLRRKGDRTEPSSTIATGQKSSVPPTVAMGAPIGRKTTGTEATSVASATQNHMASSTLDNAHSPRQPKKKKSVRFDEEDAPMFVDEPTSMEVDPPAGTPSATSDIPDHVPSPLSGNTPGPAQPRRKKSVRFGDGQEPAAMEIEVPTAAPTAARAGGADRPDLTSRPDISTRVVETRLRFGFIANSEPIIASLDGFPSTSDDPWLCEFLKSDVLRLQYTCLFDDFAFQRPHVWQHALCAGKVFSGSSGPVLEMATAYLREGTLALYHSTPTYSIIMYPASSDQWRSVMAELGVPPPKEAGSCLRYCIFRSPDDMGPFLRRPAAEVPEKTFASYEENMMWRLFSFEYQALLPPSPQLVLGDVVHHCFLLFPRDKTSWVRALSRWFRMSSPKCHIYAGYDPGSWSSFCDAASLQSGSGIVIVHEMLVLSLRRVPGLWNRLRQYRDTFWCFSEALQPQPLFPSLTAPEDVVPPGDVKLVQLFPIPKRRLALLATPSFLCSEPQRAYELLQWFYDTWAQRRSPTCRLVTAYNLHEYLEELALQKARERGDVLEQYKHNVTQAEITANVKGLSQDDCAYRFKAWSVALELHYLRTADAGTCEVNEDLASLQYAGQCIDPNDEESLVNWFGWWSSMRMDQFREFHVVGSNSTIRFNGSQKGARVIRIPKYSSWTINDPDIVLEEVQRVMGPASHSADVPRPYAEGETHSAALPPPARGPPRPHVFQSRRLTAEHAAEFRTELDLIRRGAPRFLTLYLYPVSWTERGQSFHFGDVREDFNSITRWWDFSWPFSTARPFNTYIGYFYTLEDWDAEAPPDSRSPVRHPWLLIYRTVDGKRLVPIRGCELFIWDPAARDRFPAGPEREIREEDLAYGQRKAIEFIRARTSIKNPGSSLDRVWYSGFDHPPNIDSPHNIDIALSMLGLILKKPFDYLPIYLSAIAAAGYRPVTQTRQVLPLRPTEQASSSPMPEPMDIDPPESDKSSADEGEDVRIIFHPPRGRPMRSGERTRCVNHLFEQASAARREDSQRTHMTYEFAVTTDWYNVQRFEGRGFEHVHVAPWEDVFNMLKIQVGAPQASSTTRTSTTGQEKHVDPFVSPSVDGTLKE